MSERASSPFLLVEDVAEREQCSTRTIYEWARLAEIPHLKRSGSNRLLFRLDWLEEWDQGAELVIEERPRGGRIVRPRATNGNRRTR
jgi:hypothetical protein